MNSFIETLSFGTPLALLGLLALPVIWWLLRFTPPRPQTVKFPPIRILLGIPSQEQTHEHTPLWLLLLRLALAALLALAVAQPFLQPKGTDVLAKGHRLVIIDDGWAAADGWEKRQSTLIDVLENARSEGSPITLVGTSAKTLAVKPEGEPARDVIDIARVLKPSAVSTNRTALLANLEAAKLQDLRSIIWLSDGIDANSATAFAEGLAKLAPNAALRILAPPANEFPLALGAMTITGSEVSIKALRPQGSTVNSATLVVKAINGRTLLEQPINFATANEQPLSFSLPTALRNEIQTLAIADQDHAGARQLFDDRWRKRTVALQSSESTEQSEAQPLLSLLHYVRRGLEPFAELQEPQSDAELANLLDAGLSMLVQADIGEISESSRAKLAPWIEKGGILLRFAGPRLAAAHDDLLPVVLRAGDRTLGSALSWDVPQGLQEFQADSIFAGLRIDPAVKIIRQVLAEPDAEIASRTWASLDDGTPLVTAQRRGKGLVILFHVTANASWSNLPLSGLFLEMLQRVAGLDPTVEAKSNAPAETTYQPRMMLNGTGELTSADGTIASIPASEIDKVVASSNNPPGLYVRQGRERALNLSLKASDLIPMPQRLAGVSVLPYAEQPRQDLAPWLFMLAALLFAIDTLAAVVLDGGLKPKRQAATAIAFALMISIPQPVDAVAQDKSNSISEFDTDAALNTRLAYVTTGDVEIDRTSKQGLFGLTFFLTDRTSAALAEPVGIDMERDDPVFYPLIYWPVADNAESMDEATRKKVETYLKNGGTIFFDTRNGGIASDSVGGDTALQKLLKGLDLPPLEPVPDNHVLARSFYLLDRFPGRFDEASLWVEASANEPGSNPGTADGVSSIIIGANDYAAAWAIDDNGQPLYAVVPGTDRQREFAMRTGINIVMYALTGNYKADQVHVPALLERLGQ